MSTPHEWLHGSCQCIKCRAEMRPVLGKLEYSLPDMHLTVEDVPMSECTACGYRVIPGPAAVAIDDIVQDYVQAERERRVVDRVTLHYRQRAEAHTYAYAD